MTYFTCKLMILASLTACIPVHKADLQSQSTNVTFVGSFSGTKGATEIYFGQEKAPLAKTISQGTFRIEIPRAMIEESSDRRLYFYSNQGEAAASNEIMNFEIGEKNLDPIVLTAEIKMNGSVLTLNNGVPTPVPFAEITVGRRTTQTDAEGKYTVFAPSRIELPVLIHKEDFVQTKALWQINDATETRNFHLYKRLEPIGHISFPSQALRTGTTVPVFLDSTQTAAYIRIASVPFTTPAELDGSWLNLSKPISLPTESLSQLNLYYQFADKDKKVLSPILIFSNLESAANAVSP